MMHVHNLLWFTLMVASAGFYYRKIMGAGMVAGLAAILFAIDDAHAWPAGWIANRNALIAMTLCLLALMMHHRWRENRNLWAAALGVTLYGASLFAKESTVAIFGYLVAYAFFLDNGKAIRRLITLVPYMVVTILWRMVYVSLDFGAEASGGYIDPLGAPLQFAKTALYRIPILLQGQWVFAPVDILLFAPPWLRNVMTISAWTVMLMLATILYPLLKRNRVARFWCLGMCLATVPLAAASPQDRLLLFPGLGAMGLLAQLLVALKSGDYVDANRIVPRKLLAPIRYALVAIHLVIAPILLPLTIVALGFMMGNIDRNVRVSLLSDESIVDKTLILANGANYPVGSYLYIIRGLEGQPTPKYLRSFALPTMAAVPMDITRVDELTVTVRPEGGYPWSLFRTEEKPFAPGDTHTLTGMMVEVTQLSEGGWPSELACRFEKSLDDPSYLWYRINGFDYEPMPVPAIGETVRLEIFE
ncbi:MAG: hypothetical protein VCD00_14160 [Candidatus Hydrogenedentota bacterium]